MPGKSHKKSKGKSKQRFQPRPVQEAQVIQMEASVVRPAPAAAPAHSKLAVPRYGYIASELRTITILSILMLIIIVVLALVL